MRTFFSSFVGIALLLFFSCIESNPNEVAEHKISEENRVSADNSTGFNYPVVKGVYVPVYSDIYSKTKDIRFLLTVTLSIRNTSKQNSLYMKNTETSKRIIL